jgi:MFS family permease
MGYGSTQKVFRIIFAAVSSEAVQREVYRWPDIDTAAISLAAAFFFVELVVAPIWAVPMDIAPKYSGSASGMMNFGFGVAGIISPFVFGYLIDRTGSWTLPFAGSICLLLLGAGLAFRMHPDRPFEPAVAAPLTA